jgi:hypothetical protein
MKRTTMLALLGLCIVLRVVSLVRPCLSDDEAIYAVVAREMLSGHELYVDIVDHKPPAIYVVYAAAQALGPVAGMVAIHVLLIGVVFATGLLLARIVRRHWAGTDPQAPAAAALLWIVFTTTLADVDALAANCELFMMLPLVGAVAVFCDARRLAGHALAGALVGIACLFKYQAGVQLAVFGIAIACDGSGRTAARRLAAVFALGVGFAAPLAVSAAVLYGLGASAIVAGRRDPFVRLMTGWVIASAIAVCVGGRFFGHYFHQLTAPLAILAAPATVRLWHRRRALVSLAIGVPAITYLALGVLHDRVMAWYGEPDPEYRRVVDWLDARGDGALCVWGNSPVLYFEAARPLGCRFVFANYLTGASPATASQTDASVDSSRNIVPEAWAMLERDLAERRPRFIVDGSPGNVAYYGKYPPARFPRLARVLDCAYAPAAEVAGMRIYERRATPRCERQASGPAP